MKVRPFIQLVFARVIAAGVASTLLPFPSAASYFVTDLGTLGGDHSSATDINESGQVVGVSRTASGHDRAFLWQAGQMTDLGTLGGTNSHAAALNETGGIVGWAETSDGRIRACLFGTTTNLDLSGGHGQNSFAADINAQGRVVGWTETPITGADQPRPTAVLFGSNPTLNILSVWSGSAVPGRATVINNHNLIGGWTGDAFWTWGPHDRATSWENLNSASASRFGGIDSHVRGLNETGQMVGESGLPYAATRAVLWSGTNHLGLGSLALGSSTAAAINQAGQIVGSADAYRFGFITNRFPGVVLPGADTNGPPPEPQVYLGYEWTRHAFLWQNGVMSDLNDLIPTNSGWELTEAAAINDAGQIVGTGRFNGQTRAFLLTLAPNPNAIPIIRWLAPLDGEWVTTSRVTLHTEASDADGSIQRVDYFAQRVRGRDPFTGSIPQNFHLIGIGNLHPPGWLGSATNSPFMLEVTNLASGNYLLLAKAFDDQGASACAPEVLLRVNAPPRLSFNPALAPPLSSGDDTLKLHLINANEEKLYDIEASTDLVHWTNVGYINPSSRSWNQVFRISELTNAHHFYRAVAQ